MKALGWRPCLAFHTALCHVSRCPPPSGGQKALPFSCTVLVPVCRQGALCPQGIQSQLCATYPFCDLGHMSPFSWAQFCSLQNGHDTCAFGSDGQADMQVTLRAAKQRRRRRRRGTWRLPGPGSPAAHQGGSHRRLQMLRVVPGPTLAG